MHTLGQLSAVNERLPCVGFFHLFHGIDVTAEEGMRRAASCWARGETPWYMIMEDAKQSPCEWRSWSCGYRVDMRGLSVCFALHDWRSRCVYTASSQHTASLTRLEQLSRYLGRRGGDDVEVKPPSWIPSSTTVMPLRLQFLHLAARACEQSPCLQGCSRVSRVPALTSGPAACFVALSLSRVVRFRGEVPYSVGRWLVIANVRHLLFQVGYLPTYCVCIYLGPRSTLERSEF